MTFGAAVGFCLRHPFTFTGRARRSEFWWFARFLELIWLVLATILMVIVLAAGASLLSGTDLTTGQKDDDDVVTWLITLAVVSGVALLLSSLIQVFLLGANARRLHDLDHSAHWLWFYLAGLGIVPVLMCIPEGTNGPNRFGPSPKETPARGADAGGA